MDTSNGQNETLIWKRRQIIINPKFQFRVIGYVLLMALLVIGILYGANQYFFLRLESTGHEMGFPANHVYFQFLREQSRLMNHIFLTTSALIFSIIVFGGALISHRVAGPIYRLCKHLVAVCDGRTTQDIHFRKKDFFPEIPETVNRLLYSYRELKKGTEKGERVA